jgi:hypothetical protein
MIVLSHNVLTFETKQHRIEMLLLTYKAKGSVVAKKLFNKCNLTHTGFILFVASIFVHAALLYVSTIAIKYRL